MVTFSKESLETLRSRIDLVEVLSPYLKLQRTGKSFKALCPFHDEKSPSFIVQPGETHYHCFGCGAHGDAIQFLMAHLKMNFVEAVETLSQRFHVELEIGKEEARSGPSKKELKEVLEKACKFYKFALLHTLEGHAALDYLYHRGIDLEFIQKFEFGLAPKGSYLLKVMKEKGVTLEPLEAAGLVSKGREFFADRITIPIRDAMGAVIGFSARKYKEETYGGKYINTQETPLFKKSKILFGLFFSRTQIAKERRALIVEGQIDALRLIHLGFSWTVGGQGTAFGEEMAKELIQLGVKEIFLALDGDDAGKEASCKIGNFFQKEGIEVFVVPLPEKWDPDLFLQEKGAEKFQELLDKKIDYLTFLVKHKGRLLDLQSPAGKSELVQGVAKQIREWDHPVMVHESLKKLAKLTHTPEGILGAQEGNIPQIHIKRSSNVAFSKIDPDLILEADLLLWLIFMGQEEPELLQLAEKNLNLEHFCTPVGKSLYEKALFEIKEQKSPDLLSLMIGLVTKESESFLDEILQKKINREKALSCFIDTIQKMLERHWMQKREGIKMQIYSGTCSEEEVLELAKQFDQLKRERPEVKTL